MDDLDPSEWWCIDPDSGTRRGSSAIAEGDAAASYLGDEPLREAGIAASHIDATFGAARHFTDDEVRQLLVNRVIPASVRPYAEAATELLESIDFMWTSVDECYQARWGRPANAVERRFIAEYAFSAMRQ
jgi:hypothetical protein